MRGAVESHGAGSLARRSHAKTLAWLLVAATIAVLIVAVVLTPHELSWMRTHWFLFNWPMGHIEQLGMTTGLNIQHILMFLWLSFLLRLTWRKATWWQLLLLLAGLAVGTELLQVFLPGRDPRVSDVRDDMLGATAGWMLAMVVLWLVHRWAVWRGGR